MTTPDFSDPEMKEIFEGFLVETTELCDNLSQDLMELENQPHNLDLLNKIFRSIHTIKGTSAFMGYDEITEITHHGEDILNKLRHNELTVTLPIIDVLLEVHDWIQLLLDKLQNNDNSPSDFSNTIRIINSLKNQSKEQNDEDEENQHTETEDDKTSALEAVLNDQNMISHPGDFTDDELLLLDKAFEEASDQFYDEVNSNKSKTTPPTVIENNDVTPPQNTEPELKPEAETVKTVKADNSSKSNATASAPKKDKNISTDTIRIDIQRVESLMDLSGELVLGRNRLAQITEKLANEPNNIEVLRDLAETTSQIDLVTSDIQSSVMRMRMVPIAKLFQKAPRIVRDLSKEFNKKIKLIVKGEDTEIDRGIIEELNDPLVHMIRNSCDHGIESKEIRLKNNKPAEGQITLDADQEGNAIVLKISDDGKGMDPEFIKNKAIEKDVITPEQASQLTRHEVLQLIFQPGFSTAEKVSAVSGRGVGMDVVRTNILNLKGMIEIESEMGVGSTFIIKLPLTLAIIQGVLVRLHNESYAIPLSSVVEVVSIAPDSIYSINGREMIRIRKEDVWPLIRLDVALNSKLQSKDLTDKYVVVVGIGSTKVGLVVDELLGQQEIVIKSIGEYLGNIKGIAGSTILGDGKVIMIIDIAELIKQNNNSQFI